MWLNLPVVESTREIERRRAESKLTFERLHDLVFAMTSDKEQAEEESREFLAAELRRGEKIECQS